MGKIEDIIKIISTPKNESQQVPEDPYKTCWYSLKDKILAIYSDINVEDIIKTESALSNEQINQVAKWKMASDIVNAMNSLESEHIKQ